MEPVRTKVLVLGRAVDPLDVLGQQLEAGGFTVVDCAEPGRAADVTAAERPDLIVLDPKPPLLVLDALAVCRQLRQLLDDPQLPVLVLVDADGGLDKAGVLEHGADDVMSRPYDSRELIARLRALLRRSAGAGSQLGVVTAGPIELDLDRYAASVAGRVVELTAKEFDLLRALIEARGRVVRREAALERVWHYGRGAGLESRTLDVHIRRLRKKLGAEGARIVTVRSVGYRMDISPSWVTRRYSPQANPG